MVGSFFIDGVVSPNNKEENNSKMGLYPEQ
jgi:hypothetical protein